MAPTTWVDKRIAQLTRAELVRTRREHVDVEGDIPRAKLTEAAQHIIDRAVEESR